jgi:hypothetical protein
LVPVGMVNDRLSCAGHVPARAAWSREIVIIGHSPGGPLRRGLSAASGQGVADAAINSAKAASDQDAGTALIR